MRVTRVPYLIEIKFLVTNREEITNIVIKSFVTDQIGFSSSSSTAENFLK